MVQAIGQRSSASPHLAVPHASGRLPNPAPGGWPCALLAARWPQDGGDTGPAWGWVTGRSRHNLEIGYSHPPLGLNLLLGSLRFQRPITQLCRASLPFLAILLVALALVWLHVQC
jgi:hypothetical protein